MKISKSLFLRLKEKPLDKYSRGFASANQALEANSSEENIIRQYRVAKSNMDPDPFTRGWLVACRKKMQALYKQRY